MQNDYYVYIYLDPRKKGTYIYDNLQFEYEPFYVGKGKNIRITKGLDDINNTTAKKLKIKEIRISNLEPISLKIYDNLSENLAFELEKFTIKQIGKSILVNKSNGSTNYKIKPEFYSSKFDKNIVIKLVGIASDFYYLHEGSKFHKDLFFNTFNRIY
jgi:hypothetical protein